MTAPNLFLQAYLKDVTMNDVNTNRLKTVELFAGVGGFRLGLEAASTNEKGYEIVWSNQWEPSTKTQHASDVYCARFGFSNHSNEDISTVDVKEIPKHDLLVGGFPCQDYSVASTLKNSHGIIGKKGVLWWEIYRILEQKGEDAPKYLMLENVDRLLKSPASQRGRDFAIILSSLNVLGYCVEWRVINASDYGMPQRRRRVFIMAYKNNTELFKKFKQSSSLEILNKKGVFAQAFPIKSLQEENVKSAKISDDLVDITNNFNKENPKKNVFLESGYMIDSQYYTARCEAEYGGPYVTLGSVLQAEAEVEDEFYIDASVLEKWQYHKGAKSIERMNKTTGHVYKYSEGSMGFPDSLEKPSRTIITGEGGAGASRFKHVVCIDGKYRRLTPVELERLNMFPDNHTAGVSNTKRAFLMGNALVVGIVEQLAKTLLKEI